MIFFSLKALGAAKREATQVFKVHCVLYVAYGSVYSTCTVSMVLCLHISQEIPGMPRGREKMLFVIQSSLL